MDKERYINLSDRQVKDTQNQSQDFLSVKAICRLLNNQDQKIADLETKLAESEEKCNKQWLEIQAETHQIQMLEQDIKRIKKEYKNLEQQLAEKEQRVAELECELNLAGITKNSLEVRAKIAEDHDAILWENLLKKCENHNQDKISFAVEQLTEIREYVKECWGLDELEGKVRLDIAKKIRLKIEQLKEGE